jgi:predicted small secreted protein
MREAIPVAHSNSRGTLMSRLIALLLIAGTAALAGCNTVSGAGQDISKGGQAISNSAEEHK